MGANCYLINKVYQKRKLAKCCGIIGFIGKQPIAEKVLLNGVEILQNRGYDSAGLIIYTLINYL